MEVNCNLVFPLTSKELRIAATVDWVGLFADFGIDVADYTVSWSKNEFSLILEVDAANVSYTIQLLLIRKLVQEKIK